KVVADMGTGNGSDAVAFPAVAHTNLGGFNFRNDNPLLSLCNVSSTSSPVHPYTELTPKDGDYTFVAEGGTKPQIDFQWVNRFAEPKKAAGYEVLSEEVATDIKRMVSTAKEYLRKKHDLFKVNGIYFGDGISPNVKGATVYARTFVAGDMALAVTTPNFMDVVNAIITDIYTTHNYVDEAPYEANVSLVNPVDFYIQLVSAKDGNGLPLYPQAGLFNAVSIGGVMIKPWSKIPAGKIFVADMKKYNVSNYIPYSIRTGWINDQMITNQFTMVGESRFFGYVKNLDEQAFVYDDIATVKAAITAV
ncbi:MAG: phage major capsid protein, partial [Gammaproteobacteria bacterium]